MGQGDSQAERVNFIKKPAPTEGSGLFLASPKWAQELEDAKEASTLQVESPEDLVFEAWATCRHKPEMPKLGWTAEERRKQQLSWRGRKDWQELNCGDDSFFVSKTKTVMGIADGVGGWRNRGVDPSLFANAFMGNSKLYADTHPDDRDAKSVLENGYGKVLLDNVVEAGSSTACGAAIVKDPRTGKSFMNLANLGDSGALLLRHGAGLIYKTTEVTHRFNFPFQLTVEPGMHQTNGKRKRQLDSMESAVLGKVEVKRGDVVVMGTDGLFDNRYNRLLVEGLSPLTIEPPKIESSGGGGLFGLFGGDKTTPRAVEVADLPRAEVKREQVMDYVQGQLDAAWFTSKSKTEATPWADALTEETGVLESGGKTDDITIVVGRVVTRAELEQAENQ